MAIQARHQEDIIFFFAEKEHHFIYDIPLNHYIKYTILYLSSLCEKETRIKKEQYSSKSFTQEFLTYRQQNHCRTNRISFAIEVYLFRTSIRS